RHQTALALFRDEDPDAAQSQSGRPDADVKLPAARELVLNMHFDAVMSSAGGTGDEATLQVDRLGRLEKGHRLALLEHVQAWCSDSHTKVSIRPVIDLNQTLTAPGYAIPDRIRDHVVVRDRTCRFPWCTQPARACDLDHVIAYDHDADTEGRPQSGPTSTANLIPLCRRHHRLKTHTGWRVAMPEPGRVTWTSPHGHQFHVDGGGTTADPSTQPRASDPPRD
ncbi:MAG: HNH endonuclease, partial [Nocardioides sp.]|nr:HNH endonuclease [Nocardioides sp.]